MSVTLIQADAQTLPLADSSVDLVVTSPPYFGLRSYTDGGEHYQGQLGAEATPGEYVGALIECTAEMVRVLKPSGSIWINLGDKYAGGGGQWAKDERPDPHKRRAASGSIATGGKTWGMPAKSLAGIPWRYAIRCIDDLGLILRAEVIWSKPNGLPESVTDRVRRSHEQWFHFTVQPRYYSAVDRVREEIKPGQSPSALSFNREGRATAPGHPLGKLPGSVQTVATEPLNVPEHLGVDHYAAFPTWWPRWIIQGWSPERVCVTCGEGLRPILSAPTTGVNNNPTAGIRVNGLGLNGAGYYAHRAANPRTTTGETCACADGPGDTTTGLVLDPFGGTGTTALVADVLGRHGISVDMSADYQRIARWRTTDPKQRARAAQRPYVAPVEVPVGQPSLLDLLDEAGEPA